MEKASVTAKDFFLWVGGMIALYGGIVAFISLVFDYIDAAFPNPVRESYDYFGSGAEISYETATLIVLTPVFMILMRLIRRDIQADPSRNETWIRRWALVLTLFLAGLAMVVDLIVALTTYLQGEAVTVAFMLKVLTVLLVAGAGFLHFLADMRGYWQREPGKAKLINYGVGVVVALTIIAGFFIIGTPQEIRRVKQDTIRVQDLQSIQWEVVNYWQQKEQLPAELAQVEDPLRGYSLPRDPATGEPYDYSRTGARSFQLCAVFEREGGQNYSIARPTERGGIEDNWEHGTGEACFDRIIDPERYPPFSSAR